MTNTDTARDDVRELLREARHQFREYASSHAAKAFEASTQREREERYRKARRNSDWADRIDAALAPNTQGDESKLPLCSDLTSEQRKFMICCDEIPTTQPDTQGTDSGLADELMQDRTFSHGCVQISEGIYYRILTALRSTDRKAVLEEAAEVAEEMQREVTPSAEMPAGFVLACGDVAKAIRALAEGAE